MLHVDLLPSRWHQAGNRGLLYTHQLICDGVTSKMSKFSQGPLIDGYIHHASDPTLAQPTISEHGADNVRV